MTVFFMSHPQQHFGKAFRFLRVGLIRMLGLALGCLLLLAGLPATAQVETEVEVELPPPPPIDSATAVDSAAVATPAKPQPRKPFQWRPLDTDATLQQTPVRQFDADNLREYRNDSDYEYDIKQVDLSWWERFKRWLAGLLRQTLFREGTGTFWETFGWIVGGLVIVYAILRLIGADPRGLFGRRAKAAPVSAEEVETDIHSVDFNQLIAEAVSKQQYKRAVRLHYLKSLKLLSDREWIDWRPYKTNYEYIRELKQPNLSPDFRRLTFLFEYVWYGGFTVTPEDYTEMRTVFQQFEQQVSGTKAAAQRPTLDPATA
ncbi:MAG: DUF4129 domain-containing protein [Cytophagales bacterium]|jgi:hypothetical protein|nr:DUF4129 domain-containing protein [Cytophagales bacterium]